ncbi:MAG: type II secretion system F family protein [Clostridiales bacterium]|nr:type II secretion system F family protein [Clostridiales bacterium]
MTPMETLHYSVQGTLLSVSISWVFYKSVFVCGVSLLSVVFYLKYKQEQLRKKRLELLRMQFRDGIVMMASLLSAGYSPENAVAKVPAELEMLWGKDADMALEFHKMSNELLLNRPIEAIWNDFAKRSGMEEAENFAQVFAIVKRSGGNVSLIIQWAVQRLNQRFQAEEQIQTMLASRKYEQKIMNSIPIIILVYINISSPEMISSMYTTISGRIIMTICLCIYLVSYGLAKKIVEIEV